MQHLLANHRIMLTGTPIQNQLTEMWSIMDWVSEHSLLGDADSFNHHFKHPIEHSQNKNATASTRAYGKALAEELRELIFSITLRREKAEIIKSSEKFRIGKKAEIVLWWYGLFVGDCHRIVE